MAPPLGADLSAQLAAMQLLDSAAPVGGFAHSMGFETYIESGFIDSSESFGQWLESYLANQLTFADALAIRLVHRATEFAEVVELDWEMHAQTLAAQIQKANTAMGKRLLRIACQNYAAEFAEQSFPAADWLHRYEEAVSRKELYAHSALVWGVVSRNLGMDEDTAVSCHLYATAIMLTQNAVRAVPLGQDAGQRVQRHAQDWVVRATSRSRLLGRGDFGANVPGLEIAQMQHEHQRARLFMS